MRLKLFFVLLLSFVALASDTITGLVVGVSDGDTFTLLTSDKKQIKVRMQGIDSPEKVQPFGMRAKQQLSDYIYKKNVKVRSEGQDRYGRTLGTVFIPGNDASINALMIAEGYAWHYKQYSNDDVLDALEENARKSKKGLWSEPGAIAPWEFRRGQKTQSKALPDGSGIEPGETVIFNKSSLKYHCMSCSGALRCSHNCIEVSLQQAIKRGAKACGICGGKCQ